VEKIVIKGGKTLSGEVRVSGAKNAAFPVMAACLMTDDECIIEGVPALQDVLTMSNILRELGMDVTREGDVLKTKVVSEEKSIAPYEYVRTMRGSVSVLGPLLAKRGAAQVSLPGGCVIGSRPIDLHIKGLKGLGADIAIEHGYVVAKAERLTGANLYLGGAFGSTATGTCNIMSAAALADGVTVIEHAACEPEVKDLADFLNRMGAAIEGAGTHRIVVRGVRKLHGTRHRIIPDRIEAGTFLIAGALGGGEVVITHARAGHLDAVVDKLEEGGVTIEKGEDSVRVTGGGRYRAVETTTLPYPGFPTDMQAQLMVFLALAEGSSVITEKVFPDRFMHIGELNRMGAEIVQEGPTAIITGVGKLSGVPVMASDLRASAALVLGGLVASGTTEIRRIYHLDRGYEQLEEKLRGLGADIERVTE